MLKMGCECECVVNAQHLVISYCRACHKILVPIYVRIYISPEECVKTTDIMLSRMSQDMAPGDGDPTEGKMSFPCFLPPGCFFFSPQNNKHKKCVRFHIQHTKEV